VRRGDGVVAIALVLGLSACGGGSAGTGGAGGSGAPGGSTISSAPLSGTVGGQPWTFAAGQTDAFLSTNSDTFFANLFDVPVASPCVDLRPAGVVRSLILNIPKAVGHYAISLQLNQTFSYDDGTGTTQNDVATSGALDVTSITDTTLKGGVKMAYGAPNSVDGQFEITICTQ
jgi:hypothetical protein